MNSRLEQQYSQLEAQNKIKLLRNEIRTDSYWGKDIWGVTLQIDLSDDVKSLIKGYQKELVKIEPHSLLIPPKESLHVSFNQVIYWGGSYPLGLEGTWKSIEEPFLTAFRNLDKKFHAFKIVFSKLIATANGVIICGYDENDELDKLREEFAKSLPIPKETKKKNHIIHATVARYKQNPASPHDILAFVDNQSRSVEMTIKKISLRKELVFPSLKMETLAEIELS